MALGFPGVDDKFATTNSEFTGNYYNGYPIYRYTYIYNGSINAVTITTGTIGRYDEMASENKTKVLKHDAVIDHGNSGGPLINAEGKALGINSFGGSSNASQNYAVYIDYVRDYLDDQNIPYNVHKSSVSLWMIIGIIAIVAVVIAIFVFIRKKKSSANVTPTAVLSRSVQSTASSTATSNQPKMQSGNQMRFCPNCGAPLKDNAKFCVAVANNYNLV